MQFQTQTLISLSSLVILNDSTGMKGKCLIKCWNWSFEVLQYVSNDLVLGFATIKDESV